LYEINLNNKTALIFGFSNHRSIAWHTANKLYLAGATIIFSVYGKKMKENLLKTTADWNYTPEIIECDVSSDDDINSLFTKIEKSNQKIDMLVHSIAMADKNELGGDYLSLSREGFKLAMDISAYSFVALCKGARNIMNNDSSIITYTFQASEKVFPGYNVMGTAKAALEHEVRQIAFTLGESNIRVNAISAGPLDTISSRVIQGYKHMKSAASERSPLKRNITLEEVANSALFLLSDMSSGITGETLHVDSGYNIMGI
jgi:enoyl-[acyl-carrier protein] reductase I